MESILSNIHKELIFRKMIRLMKEDVNSSKETLLSKVDSFIHQNQSFEKCRLFAKAWAREYLHVCLEEEILLTPY